MSDFFNNKNESAEESTVFAAPVEHKDKAPHKSGKKRLVSIIATFLAVAVLVGGTLAVIKLIPEMKKEEAPPSVFEDIPLIDADSKTFLSVTIKNSNGEFKFLSQKTDEGSETSKIYWTVDGVDYSKLNSTSVDAVVSSAASVSALKKVDKAPDECGLNNPKIKVDVQSSTKDSYTFVVGDKSPDGFGSYVMVEGSNTVYVAPDSEFEDFNFTLLDLTDKSAIPATTFTVDTSSNKVSDGTYAYFDSIVLSGKFYSETVTITNSPDDPDISSVAPYMITTPVERFADIEAVTPVIYLFSRELNVSGNYALDVTDETLKLFRLDAPDIVATMTIKGETKTFKISKIDSSYCAVVYDGATMIRKVDSALLSFLDFRAENYYHKSLCMYPRNNVSKLKLTTNENDIEFVITKKGDNEANQTYQISAGGISITEDNFKDLYKELLMVQCSSFSIENISSEPDGVISFTFFSGNNAQIKFYKVNETEYQYSINNVDMGRIPSATYNKLIKNFKTVSEGGSLS